MKKFLLVFAQIIAIAAATVPVRAAESYDPSFVLSDRDLTGSPAPYGFSQRFLESRGGALAKMRFPDIDGTLKSPGDLIDYYAEVNDVNPRFLLALIQKEQSLVEDRDPSQCQIDWATGYGRPDGSTCNDPNWQKYRGFVSQIVHAAEFVKYFYDKQREGVRPAFGYYPGVPATINGSALTPANMATAILYTYTPHLHGNRLLATIWNKWFASEYPDGTLLTDGTATYLIQGGLKRKFATKAALASRFDPASALRVERNVLDGFEDGASIRFPDYALVRAPNGTVYMLVRDEKRPISSQPVFRSLGFNPEEVDDVGDEDLAGYAEGEAITLADGYPTGALLQNNKTGGVYFVENGRKFPIISAEIMKRNFPGRKISPVAPSILEELTSGEPVRLRDGELITSPGAAPAVFVVSNGQRRPILSGETFEALGYDWKRILRVSDATLNLHALGEAVTLQADSRVQAAAAR